MEKVAVVTGCSSGIGYELALRLNYSGWKVFATARHIETMEPLREAGCHTYQLDVGVPEEIDRTVDKFIGECGRIDMLINNAGYGLIAPSAEISTDEMQRQFQVNVFGMMAMIQKTVPVMKLQKSGLIINIGSISGIAPTPFSGAYCASKAAIHAWSDVLRMELKPFGIHVITVQPGGISTNFGNNCEKNLRNLLKPDSWYSSIESFIYLRARTSQEKATPVAVFAEKLISEMLQPDPPPVIRIGKRSITLPLMKRCVPAKLLDKIMMKKYGLNSLNGSSN